MCSKMIQSQSSLNSKYNLSSTVDKQQYNRHNRLKYNYVLLFLYCIVLILTVNGVNAAPLRRESDFNWAIMKCNPVSKENVIDNKTEVLQRLLSMISIRSNTMMIKKKNITEIETNRSFEEFATDYNNSVNSYDYRMYRKLNEIVPQIDLLDPKADLLKGIQYHFDRLYLLTLTWNEMEIREENSVDKTYIHLKFVEELKRYSDDLRELYCLYVDSLRNLGFFREVPVKLTPSDIDRWTNDMIKKEHEAKVHLFHLFEAIKKEMDASLVDLRKLKIMLNNESRLMTSIKPV